MATLSNYDGNVDIISGLRPKNGGKFPIVEAHDILVGPNDRRLDYIIGDTSDSIAGQINSKVTTLRSEIDRDFFDKNEIADLLYELIDLSISPSSGIFEIGSSNSIPITWTATVKRPNTLKGLKINNVAQTFTANLTASNFTGTGNATGITKGSDGNITVPIIATDNKGTKTVNYTATFTNKIYYGKATAPSIYNAVFIKSSISGGSTLQTGKGKSFTTTTESGEYIYYALPTAYGTPTFRVGGFDVSFAKVASGISVTNNFGYSTNYDVWRSPGDNNGTATTVVS